MEKQKEQKSSQLKQHKMQQNLATTTAGPTNDTAFANIRVTLKNESRFIETDESNTDHHEERMSLLSSSPPPLPSSVAKLKDSLKKKVLLKNTLSAAAAASNESITMSSQSAAKANQVSQMPTKNEKTPNELQADADSENRQSNEEEITALRNTEAKLNACR